MTPYDDGKLSRYIMYLNPKSMYDGIRTYFSLTVDLNG